MLAPTQTESPKAAPSGRWMRAAVVAVFFLHGFLFASWTAHIPDVKAHLRLGDSSLGLALLAAPVGSVLAMLIAARLLPRSGSRRIVRVALCGYCLSAPLVGLSDSFLTFFLAFMTWGAFQGALDVSMNTQAISVEGQSGRKLMSGFHGSWSMGSLAGAGVGVLGVGLGWTLSEQLLLLAVPCLLVVGWLTTRMIPDKADIAERASDSRQNKGRILQGPIILLAAIAFADMLCEGAVADWAAVYLRGSLHVLAAVAGLGYAAYLLTMMTVRLVGNKVITRFPVRFVLPIFAVVAAVGFAAGLTIDQPVAVLIGYCCVGAGVALVVPNVFSACGHIHNVPAGKAVATVSACGWFGFVLGPPLIGELAKLTSLRLALFLLVPLTGGIAVATATAKVLRVERPAT
jgi:MFS family permease